MAMLLDFSSSERSRIGSRVCVDVPHREQVTVDCSEPANERSVWKGGKRGDGDK